MCHINNTEDEDTSDEFEDFKQDDNERLPQEPERGNANTDPNTNNHNGVSAGPRRSVRQRKQPEGYGQSLPSNIVT